MFLSDNGCHGAPKNTGIMAMPASKIKNIKTRLEKIVTIIGLIF
jgi:hypothetical protein